MKQALHAVSLVVPDYDQAIAFYCDTLGWTLTEDVDQGSKRWVRILPPGATTGSLILARANGPAQEAIVGNQFGGRIGLFLTTDDFARDHARMRALGVVFEEEPRYEPYGIVAVWRDPFGNRWDLLELKSK
ncbi:VOC family protein [Epibacterium sp. SM1979]|uniref:VOC family protein n=1 Tax=Tritonibacter litoralis TaxID=2662264 RepID=A0A843Y930_9RHOB|nr:VOC family protein [Tritonibacter litoralis]MQQ07406.1 VOC family protein [Tritonibacter litoralis]